MSTRPLLGFAGILVACVGCDHASKQAAASLLADSAGLELAGGLLRFQLASNPGAFLSFGADLSEGLRSFFFIGLVPLLIAFVCLYFATSAGPRAPSWRLSRFFPAAASATGSIVCFTTGRSPTSSASASAVSAPESSISPTWL
jgi:hypothetical protein